LLALRQALFSREPFCRICTTGIATIRDHIQPLAEGGSEDESNIQPICADCDKRKSHRESWRIRRMGM
jgi:5-methylcytosine-specific restriction enzyme A